MNEQREDIALKRRVRRGFEPETSVDALGWVGKRVECREDGGHVEERGHFVEVARADDRPHAGQWGWFYTTCGAWLHSSEVYPPNNVDVERGGLKTP